MTKKEIKKLSEIIRAFGRGMEPAYFLLAEMDDLSEWILKNGYRKVINDE